MYAPLVVYQFVRKQKFSPVSLNVISDNINLSRGTLERYLTALVRCGALEGDSFKVLSPDDANKPLRVKAYRVSRTFVKKDLASLLIVLRTLNPSSKERTIEALAKLTGASNYYTAIRLDELKCRGLATRTGSGEYGEIVGFLDFKNAPWFARETKNWKCE